MMRTRAVVISNDRFSARHPAEEAIGDGDEAAPSKPVASLLGLAFLRRTCSIGRRVPSDSASIRIGFPFPVSDPTVTCRNFPTADCLSAEPSLGGSTAQRGRTLRAIRRVLSVHIVGRFLDALSA
jgi:hypothetical protein